MAGARCPARRIRARSVTKILIADDEALVRGGMAAMLSAEDDLEIVGEAIDGADAVEQALLRRPDVVLMDIRMPNVDGIEATRRLASRRSPARVLIVTTFDLDEYVLEALRAGASGFVLKDTPPARLAEAVRLIATGEALLAPTITRRLVEHYIRQPSPDEQTAQRLAELTERERETLRLIARGLSNAQIAQHQFVAEATVKTHVSHILTKLDLRDRVQAVVLAYETGIVKAGQTPDSV
ncbi:MAG: response regulator transcription factor [Solirubrobacterales bacterium]|nr:response regulator transcription factor [Solirubrobacterales bacterium]